MSISRVKEFIMYFTKLEMMLRLKHFLRKLKDTYYRINIKIIMSD